MKKAEAFAEQLRAVLWRLRTWGEMERAAAVADRLAFWAGKSEAEARDELHRRITERLKRGELRVDGFAVVEVSA